MKKKITVKRVALCLCLCILTVLFCDLFLPENEAQVYDSVIRLHVLAASDTASDQSIKLLVRDAILKADLFKNADSVNEAKQNIQKVAEKAVEVANALLEKEGIPYRASYAWGKERYPTREYDGLKFPAGTYLSLRIVLGEGEGQNWWCVLFPPLCLGAARQKQYIKNGEVFSTKSKKYSFRFKLLELFN